MSQLRLLTEYISLCKDEHFLAPHTRSWWSFREEGEGEDPDDIILRLRILTPVLNGIHGLHISTSLLHQSPPHDIS